MYVRAALYNIFYHNVITSLMKALQYCFSLKQLSPCIEMVKLRNLISILSIGVSVEALLILDWGTYYRIFEHVRTLLNLETTLMGCR